MSPPLSAVTPPGSTITPGAMVTLSPFTVGDYLALGGQMSAAQALKAGGLAYTGRLGGRIVGAAGFAVPWPGLAVAWAVIAPWARAEHPLAVHRCVLRTFARLLKEGKYRRVEAAVRADWPEARRWAERLGFHVEHLMPAYGPAGETYVKYVLLPQEGTNG